MKPTGPCTSNDSVSPDQCLPVDGSWNAPSQRSLPSRRDFLISATAALAVGSRAGHSQSLPALRVNAGKVMGKIRSFQGLNGPPTPVMAGLPTLVEQYRELRVNQVRTHDFMGPSEIDSKFDYDNRYLAALIPDPHQRAGVVEAGNKSILFPDPEADPAKPESYNFGPTDKVLAAIHASGSEVYYRVGRSWGATDTPPADFDKFAEAAKHIAMHYNQGWANGFHYGIRYWEFWNEPDGNFWSGSPQQFYSLYEKTARALKSVDPTLKVGGDGLAQPDRSGPYLEGFLDYCAAHKAPLDFFSWHTYTNGSQDPYEAVRNSRKIRSILDARGFDQTESILSEWNLSADFTEEEKAELQSAHNAAYIGAALSSFQDSTIDRAHFYRGDAAWMGLFDVRGKYYKTAYAFRAMGAMLHTPMRLECEGFNALGLAGLAGRSADGKTVQIFLSNYEIPAKYRHAAGQSQAPAAVPHAGYDLLVDNLPWGKNAFTAERYRIDDAKNLELVGKQSGHGSSLRFSNSLPPNSVELIVVQLSAEEGI